MDNKIIEQIKLSKLHRNNFNTMVNNFPEKLKKFNPLKNAIPIIDYFGEGKGKNISRKLLLENSIIKPNWVNNSIKDFKGIYVFITDNTPFYVGISKKVIHRIQQHVKGNSHNTSSLAYRLGILNYKIANGVEYNGKRNEFNFVNEVEPMKRFLMNQKIAFLPIENDEELYLFEVYCAMQLKTSMNEFKTH